MRFLIALASAVTLSFVAAIPTGFAGEGNSLQARSSYGFTCYNGLRHGKNDNTSPCVDGKDGSCCPSPGSDYFCHSGFCLAITIKGTPGNYCGRCPANQVPTHEGKCICPEGTTKSRNDVCIKTCAAGPSNVLENGTCCQACPDKHTRPAHVNSCTCYPPSPPPPPPSNPLCPSGQRFDQGLSICICISLNSSDCSICNYPNVRDSKNFCHAPCPPPSTWNVEHRRCDTPTSPPPTVPPPTPVCPSGQAYTNGKCACPSGSPTDKNGVCCFSPNILLANGSCAPPCGEGQVRNYQGVCECPAPFIFNKGLNKCITCPHGSVETADGNCFSCPAGQTPKSDGTCVCAPGSGQSFVNGRCECPSGNPVDAKGVCCGFPLTVEDGKCVPFCEGGQTRAADGSCKCPPNSVFNSLERKCIVCPPGSTVVGGGCLMKTCPAGASPMANGECPPPACAAPNTIYEGACVPPCGYGQVRNSYGCQCPDNTEWKSTHCEPKKLPRGAQCTRSDECQSLICLQVGGLLVKVSTCV